MSSLFGSFCPGRRGRPRAAHRRWWVALLATLLGSPWASPTVAQAFRFSDTAPGGEVEGYLRGLQTLGEFPLGPWSIRPVSLLAGAEDSRVVGAHPWAARLPLAEPDDARISLSWLNPRVDLGFNPAFPAGQVADGVWTGRGTTIAGAGGLRMRAGPLLIQLAPEVAWAENREFPLAPGSRGYRHQVRPHDIDLPQRFGDDAVRTVGPGQSTIGFIAGPVIGGLSSARQHWGPAVDMPLLVGPAAPGFLHVYLGTSRPLGIGIGSVHGRIVWGRLEQSDHSTMPADSARRLLSGVVAVFVPWRLDGLEVGLGRVVHEPLPASFAVSHLTKPFGGIFAETTENTVANQVASIFFRWAFPRAGFEVYGEHVREDFSYNLREFWLNPDLNAGHLLGARRTWRRSADTHVALRGEVFSGRWSPGSPLGFHQPVYVHHEMRQGHTHRGQLLGAASALGGAGSAVSADIYHPGGRWTAAWFREQRAERRTSDGGEAGSSDVLHTLRIESLFFHGGVGVRAGLDAAYNLNRNFQNDVLNLGLRLGIQARID